MVSFQTLGSKTRGESGSDRCGRFRSHGSQGSLGIRLTYTSKIAAALGAEVTVFSTSPSKEKDAKAMGATHFVLSSDDKQMQALKKSFNLIINTAPAAIDIDKYIGLLKTDGQFVFVSAPLGLMTLNVFDQLDKTPLSAILLLIDRVIITGSKIGSYAEVQEMLEFFAKQKIAPMIEVLPVSEVNTALHRLEKNDVKYRFVLEHPAK